MRFLFMTSSSSLSGGTRQAMYLAQGLSRRGHELTFFVPHNAEITGLDQSIDWQNMPEKRSDWRKFVERFLPSSGEPCIAHAFHNKANKKLSWWSLSWRSRGVVCVGYRGVIYRPNNPLPYWSPGMDCYVVNSNACGKVIRSVGCPKNKIRTIYNGVPQDRIATNCTPAEMRQLLGIPENAFVVGAIVGDKPVKGLDYLVKAMAHSGIDAHLVAVGTKRPEWKSKCQALGFGDRAHFPGRIENVADYLQIFDCFVLPSISESMPNVLIEAFGFGLPCIGSAVGGVPELITSNGLLVPPKKVDPLAAALQRMASDTEARQRWGRASLERAQEFTLEKKVERSIQVYNELLARRGMPRI